MNKPKTVSEQLTEMYKSRFQSTPCEICGEPTPVPYSYCFDCEYPDESEKEDELDESEKEDARKWADAERWLDDPDNYRSSNSGDDL